MLKTKKSIAVLYGYILIFSITFLFLAFVYWNYNFLTGKINDLETNSNDLNKLLNLRTEILNVIEYNNTIIKLKIPDSKIIINKNKFYRDINKNLEIDLLVPFCNDYELYGEIYLKFNGSCILLLS